MLRKYLSRNSKSIFGHFFQNKKIQYSIPYLQKYFPTRKYNSSHNNTDNNEDESVWTIFRRQFKDNIEKDSNIQRDKEELSNTYTAQKVKSTVNVVSESTKYVYDQTEGVRKEVGKTFEKTGEILYDTVDFISEEIIDSVKDQKVMRVLIDELNREYRELLEAHFSFRSDYARKQDLKNGIYYNPYTKQFEQLDDIEVDSEKLEISIPDKIERSRTKIEKMTDSIDGLIRNMDDTSMKSGLRFAKNSISFLGDKVFKPNEQSECLSMIKSNNEDFKLELFLGNVENILIPRILDAYFSDNKKEVRRYLSTNCYKQSLWPLIEQRINTDTYFDTKILAIDSTDLFKATFLENEPILIISSRLQYIHCIRDNDDGEICEGGESDIRVCNQLWGLMQDPSGDTRDWEIVECFFGSSQRLSA